MTDERPIVEQKQWGVTIWGFENLTEAQEYRDSIFKISPQYLSIVSEITIRDGNVIGGQ